MMTSDNNKKALEQKLAVLAVCLALFAFCSVLVRLFASSHTWLLAALMMGGVMCLGIGGALFIKDTSVKDDREKSHWSALDSRMLG